MCGGVAGRSASQLRVGGRLGLRVVWILGRGVRHAAPQLALAGSSSPFLIVLRDLTGTMIKAGFRIVDSGGMLLIIGPRTGKVPLLTTDS